MFAQVLQNSVYTFSAILTVFLAALALGSALANALCRRPWPPRNVLFGLLTLSGLLVGCTPLVFYLYTNGLESMGSGGGWVAYMLSTFAGVAVVLLIPTTVLGSVFPFLMKLSEGRMVSAGRTVGQLAATNTVAAILGSLAAGFVLLNSIGLWAAIRLMAVVYLVLALFAAPLRRPVGAPGTGFLGIAGASRFRPWVLVAPALGIFLFGFWLTYSDLAVTRLEARRSEELVEVWEGSSGTVAVYRRGGDLKLKINTTYPLGGSEATINQRLQAQLPMCLHPDPRSVFFLGMGTGITAGGALDFPVERVVVSELNRDVIRASRKHFRPYVNGLHDDPRVEVVNEDGRTFLAISPEQYDLVIADIFLTYKAGVGNLYTREHFETVRSRLAPGGLFAQWLPMFDLSPEEFGIIANTMTEVFAEVTLWRRSVSPRYPVFALIGRSQPAPLDREVLAAHLDRLADDGILDEKVWILNIPLAAYAGNVSAARSLFERYPISTDDRTPVEYLAPITNRSRRDHPVLAWESLALFCEKLLRAMPPRQDRFLSGIQGREIDHVEAGLAYYRYVIFRRLNRPAEARVHLAEYRRLVAGVGRAGPDAVQSE
jgi:spermidine synthase